VCSWQWISYELVKNSLEVINKEIKAVLSSIGDFQVEFCDESGKLEIYISHGDTGARLVENGSGAEKTLAALAIRIALLNISNLPKSNIFILDEPGTALDPENMEKMTEILELLKGYFKVVLLITHIDGLKDVVDHVVEIDNVEGFAHV